MTHAIEFTNVSKQYHKKEYFFFTSDLFWALRDISFCVKKGETLGLIGANGSGKTTIMKLAAEIIYPTNGQVSANGRVVPLISIKGCLDPLLTAGENISLLLSLFKIRGGVRKQITREIIDFSGLREFLEMPAKKYSRGMWSRLSFSIGAYIPSDIVLIDEALATGDMAFQESALKKIESFKGAGKTILFASHHMEDVRRICDRAIWVDSGTLRQDGKPDDVISSYRRFIGS